MAAIVDEVTSALRTFNRAVDRVVKIPPGPQRWRAANSLWLSLSPKHEVQYRAVCLENKQTRDMLNPHGMSRGLSATERSHKTLRQAMSIPAGAYAVISKADPNAFRLKENERKLFDTFPEYRTREKW